MALDEGADDYITKPFSMPELLARVRVAIRHHTHRQAGPDESVLEVGDLVIDVAHHRCSVAGRAVELTPKEFGFLSLLARWPGRILTHRMILHEVWGPEYEKETQYLRTYATNIRKKLGDAADRQRLVAKPGVGYTLLDPADETAA
jgi:two-component system KDP operon response regulator KdpE